MEQRLLALDFAHLRARDVKAEAELMTSLGVSGPQRSVLIVVRDDGQRVVIELSVGDLAAYLGLAFSTVLGKAQERPLSPGLKSCWR